MRLFDAIESGIACYPPAKRRRIAIHMLVWSLVAMFVNVTLFAFGVLTEGNLILVTLVLSWLAITITACDLVATTDVRETEESPNSGQGDH